MVCIHHHSPLSLQKGQVGRYSDWKQSDETHPVEASYERMFVWASISGYRHPRSSPAGLTPRHRGVRHAQRPRSNNSAADHETQQWLRARGATQAAHGGGKPRQQPQGAMPPGIAPCMEPFVGFGCKMYLFATGWCLFKLFWSLHLLPSVLEFMYYRRCVMLRTCKHV